jgi:hypothetical protein
MATITGPLFHTPTKEENSDYHVTCHLGGVTFTEPPEGIG